MVSDNGKLCVTRIYETKEANTFHKICLFSDISDPPKKQNKTPKYNEQTQKGDTNSNQL